MKSTVGWDHCPGRLLVRDNGPKLRLVDLNLPLAEVDDRIPKAKAFVKYLRPRRDMPSSCSPSNLKKGADQPVPIFLPDIANCETVTVVRQGTK